MNLYSLLQGANESYTIQRIGAVCFEYMQIGDHAVIVRLLFYGGVFTHFYFAGQQLMSASAVAVNCHLPFVLFGRHDALYGPEMRALSGKFRCYVNTFGLNRIRLRGCFMQRSINHS